MKFITKNPKETRDLAKKLIHDFLEAEKNRKQALIISLEGDLGAGKTTFTQGLAKELGVHDWIKSPTNIIMREHKLSSKFKVQSSNLESFYHIDCYRLQEPEHMLEMGFKDIISDPENIVLIEWGEKLTKLLPRNIIRIKFKHLKEEKREITVC